MGLGEGEATVAEDAGLCAWPGNCQRGGEVWSSRRRGELQVQ